MRISYSALDSFLVCPAKYKFSEIDKIKTSKSKEAIFGTLIHETLRLVHDPKRLVPPSEEEMLKFFTNSWNKGIYSSEAEEAVAFEQGIRILKEYYAKNYPANFHIIDLESFLRSRWKIPDKRILSQGKLTGLISWKTKLWKLSITKHRAVCPARKKLMKTYSSRFIIWALLTAGRLCPLNP